MQKIEANATWRPIGTAPKDGTEFVAAYANQGFVKQLVSFSPFHNIWVSKGEWVPGFEANATHWFPLPPAPNVELTCRQQPAQEE